MTHEKLKVLIVDESVVNRHILSEAIGEIPEVEVAAVAATGKIAMARLRQKQIDLVFFDLEMKNESPLTALRNMRSEFPDVGLVLLSELDSSQADLAISALQMGALDLLAKPESGRVNNHLDFRARLEPILRVFSGKKHVLMARRLTENHRKAFSIQKEKNTLTARPEKYKDGGSMPKAVGMAPAVLPKRIDLVAIGVSTGGPKALNEVVPGLPDDLGVPVLLVQHMPPLFTAALANSLGKKSRITVQEAANGMELLPNCIYLAPGGKHMVIGKTGEDNRKKRFEILLNSDPPVNSCRPAVDVLFRSLAEEFDGNILAVIMTGMGNDGAEGIRMMKANSCYCLSQTEETCVVYGMPRAVDDAGLSDERIPLHQMAERITALVKMTD